jgi:multidrug efflux pump subunit AcrA (membrane-fusion protein)
MDKLAESRNNLLAETLDQDITDGMLLAGSKCETNKGLPKSGKVHEAQTALRIYQNVLSQLKNKRDLTLQIEKCQVQLQVALTLATTIQDANLLLRKAQQAVQKLAQKAYDLKKQQDERVAALLNAEPGSTKEKILQRVERAEHTKAMFLRLPLIKPEPSGGISLVKVPADSPDNPKAAKEWRTVTDLAEVEQLVIERQQVHFGQATPTPFAKQRLKLTFNRTGTSPEADIVLNGDCTP